MNILFDTIEFLFTTLIFSTTLFCLFIYIKTKDVFIGRTLSLMFLTSVLFFLSYTYTYASRFSVCYNIRPEILGIWEITSSFYAFFTIFVIAFSIIAACMYIMPLFPITPNYKKLTIIIVISSTILFLLLSVFIISLNLIEKAGQALNKALWIFYPVGSLVPFSQAATIMFLYKSINNERNLKFARNFIISFVPQILYSIIDIFLLKDIHFQFTHISYVVFSLTSFYQICGIYFTKNEIVNKPSIDKESFFSFYNFSEREIEVLKLLEEGKTNVEISENLYISINTVKTHVKNIYKKLSVSNRVQLINKIQGN